MRKNRNGRDTFVVFCKRVRSNFYVTPVNGEYKFYVEAQNRKKEFSTLILRREDYPFFSSITQDLAVLLCDFTKPISAEDFSCYEPVGTLAKKDCERFLNELRESPVVPDILKEE